MELHLHLTVAFRALDRKWGKPVDLETPEDLRTCLPAAIERPTGTFSSEEYLKTKRRPTPYSRNEVRRRRKDNVKVNDSFSDISCARIPSLPDLEELSSYRGSSQSVTTCSSVDLDRRIGEYLDDFERKYEEGSTVTLDSGLGRFKERSVFKQLKDTAKSFIDKKCKKRICLSHSSTTQTSGVRVC